MLATWNSPYLPQAPRGTDCKTPFHMFPFRASIYRKQLMVSAMYLCVCVCVSVRVRLCGRVTVKCHRLKILRFTRPVCPKCNRPKFGRKGVSSLPSPTQLRYPLGVVVLAPNNNNQFVISSSRRGVVGSHPFLPLCSPSVCRAQAVLKTSWRRLQGDGCFRRC